MGHTYAEEPIARALLKQAQTALSHLSEAELSIEGAGVHWSVNATRGERVVRTACFHYGDSDGALQLGNMGNAHLRNVSSGRGGAPKSGAEYLAAFYAGEDRVATGRTQDAQEMLRATAAWLDGADRDALRESHAFVDTSLRAAEARSWAVNEALAARGSALRVTVRVEFHEFAECWVYAPRRVVKLVDLEDGKWGCALLEDTTQLALVPVSNSREAAALVASWIEDEANLHQVQADHPEAEITEHADLFARGKTSTWVWRNLLDRFRSVDMFQAYVPLVEQILERPELRRFYAFTSLNALCFSKCSHYPFETRGLPMLLPKDGSPSSPLVVRHRDERTSFEGTVPEVVDHLVEALRGVGTTWHGTAADALAEPLDAALAALGSTTRVERARDGQWTRARVRTPSVEVTLEAGSGGAFCVIRGADRRFVAMTPEEAAQQILAWPSGADG